MSQSDLLVEAVAALEQSGVGYMLTGSLASSLQGEPRATHDVDLVVEVHPRTVAALVEAFGGDRYYIDDIAATDAMDARSMFNLIDTLTGDKVDFWAVTKDPFDVSRFTRRIPTTAFGISLCVSAPEDTILQKLRWSQQLGGSERQVRDAVGVYELQVGQLDEAYLDEWAARLGVAELLREVRQASEPQ